MESKQSISKARQQVRQTKGLASLAKIIYDLALAKDKSKPAPKEPSKSIDLGGAA